MARSAIWICYVARLLLVFYPLFIPLYVCGHYIITTFISIYRGCGKSHYETAGSLDLVGEHTLVVGHRSSTSGRPSNPPGSGARRGRSFRAASSGSTASVTRSAGRTPTRPTSPRRGSASPRPRAGLERPRTRADRTGRGKADQELSLVPRGLLANIAPYISHQCSLATNSFNIMAK